MLNSNNILLHFPPIDLTTNVKETKRALTGQSDVNAPIPPT
jgi:hypothetical protein